MVIGTAGAMFSKNAIDPPPAWNELYFYEYGYARVTAQDSSTLKWEWVNSETSQVMDTMVITQSSRPSSGSDKKLTQGENVAITVCLILAFGLMLCAWYYYYYYYFKKPASAAPLDWRVASRNLSAQDANDIVSTLHQNLDVSSGNDFKGTSPAERLL